MSLLAVVWFSVFGLYVFDMHWHFKPTFSAYWYRDKLISAIFMYCRCFELITGTSYHLRV